MLTYRHIKWQLISKLLQRAFSWRPWIPGTLKLDSILSLFKCGAKELPWAGVRQKGNNQGKAKVGKRREPREHFPGGSQRGLWQEMSEGVIGLYQKGKC